MGISVSRADAAPPPAVQNKLNGAPQSVLPPAAQAALYSTKAPLAEVKGPDYLDLPLPVKYEELQRESMITLKPDFFEGMRFEFTKPLNQNFALSHSFFLGNIEVPTQGPQVIKMPMGTYEYGANLVTKEGLMLIGRILNDGRMTGRLKYDFNENLGMKAQMQLTNEAGMSQAMLDIEAKGKDWHSQFKLGNHSFYGVNYIQSVTPNLALGGEAFFLAQQLKSGAGFAARYQTDSSIATCQVATTGLISMAFHHKVSEKVSLATDFLWNWNTRDAVGTFGYDYMLRQCRLRGQIDTNGRVGAFVEERVNVGVNFILSGELDHFKNDFRFGFGMSVGE